MLSVSVPRGVRARALRAGAPATFSDISPAEPGAALRAAAPARVACPSAVVAPSSTGYLSASARAHSLDRLTPGIGVLRSCAEGAPPRDRPPALASASRRRDVTACQLMPAGHPRLAGSGALRDPRGRHPTRLVGHGQGFAPADPGFPGWRSALFGVNIPLFSGHRPAAPTSR